jgi:nitrogen fixation/metabolism regulation signal transduction histidine kinase
MKQELRQILVPESVGLRRTFLAGDVIFRQGEPGNTLLFVLSGTVTVVKDGIEIASGGNGEFFGEMSLLENSPRFASVIASVDCQAIEYNLGEFLKLAQSEPEFAVAVMRNLSRKLRDSDSTRITELEENNERLQTKNAEFARVNDFLEKVIERSPAGIAIVDQDGKIELINPAGRRMLNIEKDQLPMSLLAYFAESNPLQDLRIRNLSTWSGQYSAKVGSAARTFFISVSLTRATASHDRYLINFEDISELIELNDQIIKLDRFANEAEMASEIAHSINNYLTVISGNLELLQHRLGAETCEQHRRPMDAMHSSVEAIVKYVEGLMGAREESGVFMPKNLAEIVRVMVRVLRPQKRFSRIELATNIALDFPRGVVVCEAQFHQVLLNLLINAADALNSQEGNQHPRIQVTLRLDSAAHKVLIDISDNGPGIAADKLDHLFTRRFTTKAKGHGIGLITVKKIIDLHSGTITAATAPGQGTTFSIALPA